MATLVVYSLRGNGVGVMGLAGLYLRGGRVGGVGLAIVSLRDAGVRYGSNILGLRGKGVWEGVGI